MKFQITSGKSKGFVFEVTDSEATIGRRKDNVVVIEDERVSGHHARIFEEDGKMVVEDCDSVNGLEVNGKTLKKSPLTEGDVITIGTHQITVTDDPKSASPRSPSSQKKDKKKGGGGEPLKVVVAIVLVAAVVVAGWFVLVKNRNPSARVGSKASPTNDVASRYFRLSYEKIRASKSNIFRYEMKIENNKVSISVDDIKNGRQVRRSKEISAKQMADLRDSIRAQQVMALPELTEGKSPDMFESQTLRLVSGGAAKTIRVINRVLPENFKRACAVLEDFGEAELGMTALSMSGEELKKRAQDSLIQAQKLYNERSVHPENLFNSIKFYSETLWYLDTVDPKPAAYAEAVHGKQMATEELDNQLSDHLFRATRALQLKNWKPAREELSLILQKMPDTNDKRNKDAQIRLLDVEKRLQPK